MDTREAYRIYKSDDTEDATYWQAREIVFKAEAEATRAHAATPQGRLEAAERKADSMRAAMIDSGAYTSEQVAAADAEAQVIRDEIEDAAKASFAAEWTREATSARRAAWNAMVKAGKFGRMGSGKVDWAAMRAQEQKQGWTMDGLKKAIKVHGL